MPTTTYKKQGPKPRASHGSGGRAAAHRSRGERSKRANMPAGGAVARQARKIAEINALFPGLSTQAKSFGVAVLVAVAERRGAEAEVQFVREQALTGRPGARPKTTLLDRSSPDALARLLSGLAHPDRIRLARAIIVGGNTHHRLSEAVKLKAGPLYHHLRELERSGLMAIVERNTYELTTIGRIAVFATAALGAAGGKGVHSLKPGRLAADEESCDDREKARSHRAAK